MERSLSHGSRSRCPERPVSDSLIRLLVSSTTGSRFELSVPLEETVQGLKRRLSEWLRVPGERLLLLHRDERLNSGKLQDLGVVDGSRLTLMPAVEAGLMSQSGCSEQSVLQALESLTDAQVDDFLSGRSPLTLALRVCDHLMFVQLQLAAPGTSRGPAGPEHTQRTETPRSLQRLQDVCETRLAPPAPHAHSIETRQAPPTHHTHKCQSQASTAHTSHAHQSCQSSTPAPPTTQTLHTHSCQSHASITPSSHSHYVHCCRNPAPSPPTSQSHHAHSCQSPALPLVQTERSTQRCKPGAVIESLISRAPGVFSGTFSGTLHPQCQDSSGRPRRDVHTILQILNDLLSATKQYSPAATRTPGPPAAPCSPVAMPSSHVATPSSPAATLAPGSPVPPGSPAASLTPCPSATPCSPAATPSSPPATPTSERAQQRRPSGECVRQMEERAMRCRVQQVRLLLQQRRVRRRLRRHTRGPYQHSGALQMLELQTDLTA
ncbi:midnolin-A-like [Danio rerio]|uniref:Midnolin-A-like n=3 Tax=Danio rerio TaxID=7955 RepID=A0AC58I2P1_DANRE